MARHNRIGKSGEKLATECLVCKGFTIRETNWTNGKYELDIIAQNESTLVIVEVKTRSDKRHGYPEDAVNTAKIRRIVEAADAYIRMYDIPMETRFDIISIIGNEQSGFNVDHIEDAFYAPL